MKKEISKKLLSILLVVLMFVGVCGCGEKTESKPEQSKTESSTSSSGGLGLGSRLVLNYPTVISYGTKPEIKWAGLKNGQKAKLTIKDSNGKNVVEGNNLSGDSYKLKKSLTANKTYTIILEAVDSSGTYKYASNTPAEGLSFLCVAKEEQAANKGIDYSFDGKISEKVMNNYLSRAITYSLFDSGKETDMDEGFRVIANIGARYVARSVGSFAPSSTEEATFNTVKEKITLAHELYPEIIFEGCIFENAPSSINSITIPEYVLKAFNQDVKNRCFDVSLMHFQSGFGKDMFGSGSSVPDITRIETQMFFYYRATKFIDMGIEGLHLGQANLIGKEDENNAAWAKVIGMIREYAKKNARRHYVIIDAHYPSHKFVGPDGKMLVDFIAFPTRITVADGQKNHAVSENNPQKCDFYPEDNSTPALKNISGTSPSGWKSSHYPYLLEFDNYGGKTGDNTVATGIWGYDEISWFANQPAAYRRDFLNYLVNKIDGYKDNGHIAVPGKRTAYILKDGSQGTYYIDSTKYNSNGFDDEETVKKLWESKNK